jgi:hypothetical protein
VGEGTGPEYPDMTSMNNLAGCLGVRAKKRQLRKDASADTSAVGEDIGP